MSAPDPDDITLPRDPHDYSLRRRSFGLAFWAAMVFCLLCVLAGVAIDHYGPKLFPPHAPPAPQRGFADYYKPAQVPLPTSDLPADSAAPDAAKGAHGGVDAAGNHALGAGKCGNRTLVAQ